MHGQIGRKLAAAARDEGLKGVGMLAWFQALLPREERIPDPFEAHAATRVTRVTELVAEAEGTTTLPLSGQMASGISGLDRCGGLGSG